MAGWAQSPSSLSSSRRQFLRRYSFGAVGKLVRKVPSCPLPWPFTSPASRDVSNPSGLTTGITIVRTFSTRPTTRALPWL